MITKNGKQFDIPFIMTRLLKQHILDEVPGDLHLDTYDHFDLQEITSRRVSLQCMAELLGCTPKSGTGKNAIDLWFAGKYKELKEYCMQDVLTTEEVFLKWRELQGDRN